MPFRTKAHARYFSHKPNLRVLSRYNVHSRNLGVSIQGNCMAKLNQRKIKWIVKQWDFGELSHYQIAKQQKISVGERETCIF